MRNLRKEDLAAGKALIASGAIGQVFFSEGTYQVEVKEEEQSFWPFLQLLDNGEILDAFCTCDAAEADGACAHLAAALQWIVRGDPLHVRFRESLWNQIAQICVERLGYEARGLPQKEGSYRTPSFTLTPKNPKSRKQLEKIIYDRPIETEETSLKFSNLSNEELALWREGRPTPSLRYELSFWSDLAKWWMQLAEEKDRVRLTFSDEPLPKTLSIDMPALHFKIELDPTLWPRLVPSLQQVDSPLPVHPFSQGKFESITFNREEGTFTLHFNGAASPPPRGGEGIEVGDWLLIPKMGFFPKKESPFFLKTKVEKGEVSSFLTSEGKRIQKYMSGETIHFDRLPIRYELFFEETQTLRVEGYLLRKGDLHPPAHHFGDWAYLPGEGFFPLAGQIFPEAVRTIAKEGISDFVANHRVWLHNFEGFQTHVSGVESHLGYRFDEKGRLLFFTKLEFTEEREDIVDLGEWIFVRGKGFYEKISSRPGAYVKSGMVVAEEAISRFCQDHLGELEGIATFFASRCPLEKSGVIIGFGETGKIEIHPEYFFGEAYKEREVRIYGDFTYVEGEGFAPIPSAARIPEGYKEAKVIDRLAEPYFVSYELEKLTPYILSIDPRLVRPRNLALHLEGLKRDVEAKTGQWILELTYQTDVGETNPHSIWEGLKQGRPYLFSDAGLLFLRETRFNWLSQKTGKSWSKGGSAVRMTTLDLVRLATLEEIVPPSGKGKKATATRDLLHQFLSFEAPSEPDLAGLKSDLRGYQKTGVQWLYFLYTYGLSGLLCDEMGLGKTHQAMALMAAIRNETKGRKPIFLVVCPTSVIYHWEKLIEQFLPGVKPYIFHGIGRKFSTFTSGDYDLLLTSYGIVRTEQKALSNLSFDLAVFDELQVAKNDRSITNQALQTISATMRLGLSGTPIENRLFELKALLDLVIPNYLPSAAAFREHFVGPIEREGDEEKKKLLSRLVRPFLLRRKKSEVLKELPEKIEEIALCDLSDEQRKHYVEIAKAHKEALLSELADPTKPAPIAHIFSLITKLKQVCDHPCLITKEIEQYEEHSSGKWDLFCELLSETHDSGQKLVVFSQYLEMLDIMGRFLRKHQIGFAEIRGSTKDRKEQVEKFENDPKCVVFLGSLQAAGVGIDLTAASVVIHYDRWWNPAKENQATDRVHRMGQKRGVQVFKLVTKGTIEEHIHTLIEKKLHLAKGIIGFDDQDQIKGLDREELISLLRLLP